MPTTPPAGQRPAVFEEVLFFYATTHFAAPASPAHNREYLVASAVPHSVVYCDVALHIGRFLPQGAVDCTPWVHRLDHRCATMHAVLRVETADDALAAAHCGAEVPDAEHSGPFPEPAPSLLCVGAHPVLALAAVGPPRSDVPHRSEPGPGPRLLVFDDGAIGAEESELRRYSASRRQSIFTQWIRGGAATAAAPDTLLTRNALEDIQSGNRRLPHTKVVDRMAAVLEFGAALEGPSGTALHRACQADDPMLMQFLLSRGADWRRRYGDQNLLHLTAGKSPDALLTVLSAMGAQRSIPGPKPSPEEVARFIEDYHFPSPPSDPPQDHPFPIMNAPTDGDGSTPLHFAVARRSLACTELLLSHGASPSVMGNLGYTPLDIAMAEQDHMQEWVSLFLTYRSSP